MKTYTQRLLDENATHSVGEKLAGMVSAPLFISLSGPLGAGKTALIRAMLRRLGVTGAIKSPTYALVEPYKFSSYSIYHFDFYRFLDHNEWEESGFRDYFEQNAICLVEWPEKAKGLLPVADLAINLAYDGTGRLLTIQSQSPTGCKILEILENNKTNEHS